jgi:hypothetical protein
MKFLGVAVVVILTVWATFFSLSPVRGLFWLQPGGFGLTADSRMRVTDVNQDGAAARSGVQIGDSFAPTTSFENRLYLQTVRNPAPGKTITVLVKGKPRPRTVVITAQQYGGGRGYTTFEVAYYFAGVVVNLIFVLVGASLVLLRPSKMTWAFFIFSIGTAPNYWLAEYWLPASVVFGNETFAGILRALGMGAFLVFCVRVPSDRVAGGWRYLESVGAPLVVAILLVCNAIVDLSIAGALDAQAIVPLVQILVEDATFLVGIAALAVTLARQHDAERRSMSVIVGGLAIGLGALVVSRYANNLVDLNSASAFVKFWLFASGMLQVAVPLSVAYAVVRYHALNLGTIANRTLVYGLFLCAGFAVFAMFDFLLTKQLAHNQFEVGLDMAIALAIGLSFQFWHPRAIRLIDRIFLPDRYRAIIALDGLRETLGAIRCADDDPDRVVEAVATELRLASLAVFKRTPDGGFVRYAAAGWPKGSAWHVYAADLLAQSFGDTARVQSIDEAQTAGLSVPPEPNRPTMGMLHSPQTPRESLILVGAHVGGRRPDRDEVRGIATLLHEFARIGTERNGRFSPAEARRTAV